MYVKVDSAEMAFNKLLDMLKSEGINSSPRGHKILELINVNIEIENPRNRIVSCHERRMSMSYAVGELAWYLSGCNSLDTMSYYSQFLKDCSDDGKTLNSAYGYRIFTGKHSKIGFNQWKNVIDKLKFDRDSRQAIITLHTPNNKKTKDEVCTLSLQFLIRNNKLDMITTMRSNDIVLGFCYDVFCFTMLQEMMANELNVELGKYYHNAASFHIYEKDFYKMKVDLIKNYTLSSLPAMQPLNKLFLVDSIYAKRFIRHEKEIRETKNNINDIIDKSMYNIARINYDEFEMLYTSSLLLRKIQKVKIDKDERNFYYNNIINSVHEKGFETVADIIMNNVNFNYEGKKIIIEGIDAVGKSTYVNKIKEIKKDYHVRHFSKPSSIFDFYKNYKYHIDSKVSCIFDRFFLSELVYHNFERVNKKELNEMLNQCKFNNKLIEFIIIVAKDDEQLMQVYSRMDEFDKRISFTNYQSMNKSYKKYACMLIENGINVIIYDIAGEVLC